MKKMILQVMIVSFISLSLFPMQNQQLKEIFAKQGIEDFDAYCNAVCGLAIFDQKPRYNGYCKEFKEACLNQMSINMPLAIRDNLSFYLFLIEKFKKILKNQLQEKESVFFEKRLKAEEQQQRTIFAQNNNHLCNNLVLIGCVFASGFAGGVLYGFGAC